MLYTYISGFIASPKMILLRNKIMKQKKMSFKLLTLEVCPAKKWKGAAHTNLPFCIVAIFCSAKNSKGAHSNYSTASKFVH